MLVFLELNGIQLTCTDSEIIETGIKLADGEMDVTELTEWINKHN
jgi:death-on-curing protein